LRPANLLLSKTVFNQQKVNEFLDSVARNSIKSKRIYGIGLSHFQTFLDSRFKTNSQNLTLETIVEAIARNEIDVYSLLDNFVSYLSAPDRTNKLSTNSIWLSRLE